MSSSNTKNILDEFFQNLKDFGDRLSMEDIDVAVESLQIAFDDLKLMKKAAVEKRKEAERKHLTGTILLMRMSAHPEYISKVSQTHL